MTNKTPVDKRPSTPLTAADAPRLLGLARAFLDDKDYVSAEAAALAAATLDPGSLMAWAGLGVARARLARHDGAVDAFLKALAIDPKATAVWVDLGEVYLTQGRYAFAAEALRNACELDKTAATPEGRRARALVGRTLSLLRKG